LERDDNGDLFLVVDIAVQGSVSVFNSFSYQVNAIVDLPTVELKSVLVAPVLLDESGAHTVGTFHPAIVISPGQSWAVKLELTMPAPDPGVFVKLTSSAPVPRPFLNRFSPSRRANGPVPHSKPHRLLTSEGKSPGFAGETVTV
jgi:hypothetical protein